jgi:hypothetical protein
VVSDGALESSPATVSISVVPLEDPSVLAPRIVEIQPERDRLRIVWESQVRGIYRVVGKSNLEDPEWEPVTDEVEAFEDRLSAEIPLASDVWGQVFAVELVR